MSKTSAKIVALLLTLLCVCVPVESTGARQASASAEAEWSLYTYQREEFSVLLPAAPFIWDIRRPIPGNIFKTEPGRVFGAYSDGVVYTITSYDNPSRVETLDYFVNKFIKRNRTETAKREVMLGSFAGREYSYTNTYGAGQNPPVAATYEETNRIFRTDKHAYIVRAYGDSGSQAAVRKFLDSFTLSAKPQGKLITAAPPSRVETRPQPETSPSTEAARTPVTSNTTPPPSADEADRVFMLKEVSRKAVPVFRPEPGYTEEARQNLVKGVVILRLVLGADGRVSNISVVKGLPNGLTERAVGAAQHLLFLPATKDGRRVSQWVTVEYAFNIY